MAGPSNRRYAASASFSPAAYPIGEHRPPLQLAHQQLLDEQSSLGERFQPAHMPPQPAASHTQVYPTWYGRPIAYPSPPPPVDEQGGGLPHWQDFRGPVYPHPSYVHQGWINAQPGGAFIPPQRFPYTFQPTPPVYPHPGAQQIPRHLPPGPWDTQ
ncbi:hypothetical protein BC629DRAFT_1588471 [Irpex lacteus]|nr:hypothetical protein BC629DRAFT_1588471 [Irpex lacteus]